MIFGLSSFAGWDPDCVKMQVEGDATACDPNNPVQVPPFISNLKKQIVSNPQIQDRQTSEFFFNFIMDQKQQTKCEKGMLDQVDLFPNAKFRKTGPETAYDRHVREENARAANEEAKAENRSSYEIQKTILSSVFKALPHLAKGEKDCQAAQKQVDDLDTEISNAAHAATSGGGTYIAPSDYKKAKEYMATQCLSYENDIANLWSGGTGPMNAYIKEWVERYQHGSVGNETAFLKEALPVDEKTLAFTSDEHSNLKKGLYVPKKLVFQTDVVDELRNKNTERDQFLAAQMITKNGVTMPRTHDSEDVRVKLFGDGGQAALDFLNRSKYGVESKGLSCQLMHHYWETPERRKKYKNGAEIVLGGVAVIATGGAAAGLEGFAVAAFVADAATVLATASRLPKACSQDLEVGTLVSKPICEMFKPTPPGAVPTVPPTFGKEIASRASCAGTILETAMSAAGAAGTYGKAAKVFTKAAKTEGLVEGAVASATDTETSSAASVAGKAGTGETRVVASNAEAPPVPKSKAQAGRDYAPDTTGKTPEQFTQDYYKLMRNGVAGRSEELAAETPKESILRAIHQTDETELKKIQDIAINRQIGRYNKAREDLGNATKELDALKAKKLQAALSPEEEARLQQLEGRVKKLGDALKKDPVALGNGPHVQEILNNLDKNKASIRSAFEGTLGRKMTDEEFEHAYQYMRTVVAVHDLGKTFPAEVVLDVAKSFDKQAFLKGRIAMHELSSASEIQWLVQKNHLDPKTADFLVRDILGHNEGSGLPDVFWNNIAQKGLGDYAKPDSPFASMMAFVDRGGQGTLGETGGVFKITNQQIAAGRPWGKELLENETMVKNAVNTNRQMEVIASDFGKNYGASIEGTPMVQALEHENQRTIDCFNAIHWNPDNVSGTLAGRSFSNKDEFFKIINDTEKDIQVGKLPPEYWADQDKITSAAVKPSQVLPKTPEAQPAPVASQPAAAPPTVEKVPRSAYRRPADPTKDPTKLPAYGLSDDARVSQGQQQLKSTGLLNDDLTQTQKDALLNHFNPEGVKDPGYYQHKPLDLKAKFKAAKAAGFSDQQTELLIRDGYAGTPAVEVEKTADVRVAMKTKADYIRGHFRGIDPNDPQQVMMSVDSAGANVFDNALGNARFADVKGVLLGNTKKPTAIQNFFGIAPARSEYAIAANKYADAFRANDIQQMTIQKIVMNHLVMDRLIESEGLSPQAAQSMINQLTQMGMY